MEFFESGPIKSYDTIAYQTEHFWRVNASPYDVRMLTLLRENTHCFMKSFRDIHMPRYVSHCSIETLLQITFIYKNVIHHIIWF